MIEIWRAVVGYEGLYEVSNFGRVKSLNYNHTGQERILKPRKLNNGYLQVDLCKDGKRKCFLVHRLVGMTFADLIDWTADAMGKPFSELTINHLKEDCKSDNHVANLQWCPLERNLKYGTRTERSAKARSKPVCQYTLDGTFIKEWSSIAEVERQTGWSHCHISQCCNGIRNSAYGFIWCYID